MLAEGKTRKRTKGNRRHENRKHKYTRIAAVSEKNDARFDVTRKGKTTRVSRCREKEQTKRVSRYHKKEKTTRV